VVVVGKAVGRAAASATDPAADAARTAAAMAPPEADTMSHAKAVTIWHNPRCSKSRGTLDLLHAHGIEPVVVDYQKNPPAAADIEHALDLLGLAPRELMRKGEPAYAELGLDSPKLTRQQLVAAMAAHPILIERPLVFANGKAAIGRPPEAVLAIL
jgi:arsenate reductase